MEVSRGLLALSIFCMSLCFAKHGRDTQVCQSVASGVGDPGPDVKIPDQFYVHIELFVIEEGLTTTLTEYFDKVNNRGMIYQRQDGIELKAYFDYKTNELIKVYPQEKNKCIVDELSFDENNALMGVTLNNGSAKMFSAARALHFQDRGLYQGQAVVRGINTDHWHSCQYWPSMDITVEADWYFTGFQIRRLAILIPFDVRVNEKHFELFSSKENRFKSFSVSPTMSSQLRNDERKKIIQAFTEEPWDTATGLTHVPVRFKVKGTKYDSETEKHDIARVYEFYHFRSGLPKDQTILETPSGTYCPGRKIVKALPKISETMSFYTEIVNKEYVIVTTIKEEYDRTARLARFSYTALPMYNLYNKNPVIDVHDFETGVSYVTNTVLGNCTARPIPHRGLDVKDVNAHNIRMSTSESFFNFPNKTFSYEGSKTIRGTDAESWVGVLNGWPRKSSKQSVWEWYFAKDSTLAITGSSFERATPLQFRVSLPEEQIDYDFNIYAYTKEQPDLSSYDVSACYLFHKREKFGMSIPLLYKFFVESNVVMFKFFIIVSITRNLGISPLRIQNLDIVFGYELIFITFELVDVAPIVGDVANPRKEVSLDTAVKTLKEKLKANTLEVEILNGKEISVIKPNIVSIDIIKYQTAPSKTTYTSKSMAGLGVAMVLIGILVGVFFAYKFF